MSELDRVVPEFAYHKMAIEIALFDLAAKAQDISLAELLDGKKREQIPVLKMLGMGTVEWMAERAPIRRARLPPSQGQVRGGKG